MGKEMALPALVNGLALIVYMVFGGIVGRARARYNVQPPLVTGPPEFERRMRVHQNTMEQLVLFVPSLWLFSTLISPVIGAALGGLWLLGRVVYAWGYYQAAAKRLPGFLITTLATTALLLGGIVGAVMALLKPGQG